MNARGIQFDELLADNEAGTEKWIAWFRANDAALDVPCSVFNSSTVRGVVKHIFAVELRHSQRLRGEEVVAYEAIPDGSIDDLATIHRKAIENLREFLVNTDDVSLTEVIPIQTVSAGLVHGSRRKLFAHILLHSGRHWAQLTTVLRENGFKTDWPKDFFFSEAMN